MFLAGFLGHENGEFWGEDGAQIAEEVSKFLHAKVSLSSSLQPWVLMGDWAAHIYFYYTTSFLHAL